MQHMMEPLPCKPWLGTAIGSSPRASKQIELVTPPWASQNRKSNKEVAPNCPPRPFKSNNPAPISLAPTAKKNRIPKPQLLHTSQPCLTWAIPTSPRVGKLYSQIAGNQSQLSCWGISKKKNKKQKKKQKNKKKSCWGISNESPNWKASQTMTACRDPPLLLPFHLAGQMDQFHPRHSPSSCGEGKSPRNTSLARLAIAVGLGDWWACPSNPCRKRVFSVSRFFWIPDTSESKDLPVISLVIFFWRDWWNVVKSLDWQPTSNKF